MQHSCGYIDDCYLPKMNYSLNSGLTNKIYPVGSIYMSVSNTNPATLFGGMWEQLKDRFLLAAGDKYTAGNTGGEESHAHKYGVSAGELWSTIIFDASGALQNGNGDVVRWRQRGNVKANANTNIADSFKTSTVTTYDSIADTSVTSNMPPYLAIYIWKRVA